MPRTKTDDVLAASEIQHAHDPERAELIARVRRFKASWFELGEALTEIKRSEALQEMGARGLRGLLQEGAAPEARNRRQADRLVRVLARTRARGAAPRRPRRAHPDLSGGRFSASRRGRIGGARGDAHRAPPPRPRRGHAACRKFRASTARRSSRSTPKSRRKSACRASRRTINRLMELMAQARADRLVPEALCAEVEEPLARLASAPRAQSRRCLTLASVFFSPVFVASPPRRRDACPPRSAL